MKEGILQFGEDDGLLGILTRPRRETDPVVRPAFLILNAGVVHRVGPHRLGVKLARHVAAAGHASLRFDFSGFGDSRARRAPSSLAESATLDIQAAMDALEKAIGVRSFVLAGICLGADTGFAAALSDERVRGLVLLDPYAYRTAKSERRRVVAGLKRIPSPLKPGQMLRWAGGKITLYASALLRGFSRGGSDPSSRRLRVLPPRKEYAAGLRRLIDRGVEILIVHTGGRIEVYNYAEQFEDAFGRWGLADRLQCEFWRDSTHTFTSQSSQKQLLATVTAWAAHAFHAPDEPDQKIQPEARHPEDQTKISPEA